MAEEADVAAVAAAPTANKANKVAMQLNKLKEANNKYKSLLKLAKERITTQEQEMETCKGMEVVLLMHSCIHA